MNSLIQTLSPTKISQSHAENIFIRVLKKMQGQEANVVSVIKDGLVLIVIKQFVFLIKIRITFRGVCMVIVMDQTCVHVKKVGKVNSVTWVYAKIV